MDILPDGRVNATSADLAAMSAAHGVNLPTKEEDDAFAREATLIVGMLRGRD